MGTTVFINPFVVAPAAALSDTFTRADSASVLGAAESGQTYTFFGGGVWGISSNRAYMSTATNGGVAYANTGIANGTITCDVEFRANGDGIMFRGIGASLNDGWLCYLATGSIQLLVPGFGSAAINAASTHTVGVTYQIKVVFSGTAISIYDNGVLKGSTTSATNQSNTWCSMRSGGGTARWDNLLVTA
jgi:hypothetical protein